MIPVKITEAASGFEALRLSSARGVRPGGHGHQHAGHQRSRARLLRQEQHPLRSQFHWSSSLPKASERDRDKGLGLGADAYLVKPFDPEELRQVARDLLVERCPRTGRSPWLRDARRAKATRKTQGSARVHLGSRGERSRSLRENLVRRSTSIVARWYTKSIPT